MAPIIDSVEIAKSPQEVFAYLDDLKRHGEWQGQIVEHDPPRKVSFRGIDGPVRPVGTVTVEPLDDGARSRVTLELDFEGHGVGKLLAPLARRDASQRVPEDQARLKERLEGGT